MSCDSACKVLISFPDPAWSGGARVESFMMNSPACPVVIAPESSFLLGPFTMRLPCALPKGHGGEHCAACSVGEITWRDGKEDS